ncbi:MAG: DUF424 family protein, partial [Methanobacteriota archaeon]
MFYVKVHRKRGEVLVAVCDREVHNERFTDGDLGFFVDPSFYGDEGTDEEGLKELFEEATMINMAGEGCVDLAIRLGYVDPE